MDTQLYVGGRYKKSRCLAERWLSVGGPMGSVHTGKVYVFFFLLYSVMSSNHPHLPLLQNILWAPGIHLMILHGKVPRLPEGVFPLRCGETHWRKRFESNTGFEG